VLNQADELVRQVSQNAVGPVVEMFEEAPRPRSFFSAVPPRRNWRHHLPETCATMSKSRPPWRARSAT
jgi:hypothetical protein